MSTKAQRWAQKRNWFKRMLMGLRTPLNYYLNRTVCTKSECLLLDKASNIINLVLTDWDSSNPESKERYLRNVNN